MGKQRTSSSEIEAESALFRLLEYTGLSDMGKGLLASLEFVVFGEEERVLRACLGVSDAASGRQLISRHTLMINSNQSSKVMPR